MYIIFCLVTFIFYTNGFNIDTDNPIIYQHTSEGSYFGYTVNIHDGNLYVGAPKASEYSDEDSGVLYKCPVRRKCEKFQLPLIGSGIFFENGFIGGAMDINHKNNILITSAYHAYKDNGNRCMKGYLFQTNLTDQKTEILNPLKDVKRLKRIPRDQQIYLSYFAQAGFSVHLPENSDEIFLGSPGYQHWSGAGIKYLPTGETQIASIDQYSYHLHGYDVSAGHYFSKNRLDYAVGAPWLGEVKVFKMLNSRNTILDTLRRTQYGEYFGAVVASGDVNNDQLDDLIVGAPNYSGKSFNEGKVYIYLGDAKGAMKASSEIFGKYTNGQFGLTLTYLGDINNDNYGDVAVGAPYQEEHGVVYIFRGSKNGLVTEPSQIIHGKSFKGNLKGFGISISKPLDIDGNTYPDVAIGAYQSGNVVVLRSRPVVVITTKLEAPNSGLKQYSKTVNVTAIYEQTYQHSITLRRTILVDQELQRAFIDEPEKVMNISGSETETLILNIRKTTNFVDPIVLTLNYELIGEQKNKDTMFISDDSITGDEYFCIRCPVLDKIRSSGTERLTLPFQLGCGNDNRCDSNLHIQVQALDLSDNNTFVMGSKNYSKFEIEVNNTGENAYGTMLLITSKDLNLRSLPANCESNNNQNVSFEISCMLKNVIEQNENTSMNVEFDLSNMNEENSKSTASIIIKVSTLSNNENKENEKVVVINRLREADIHVTGYSGQQSYYFGNKTKKEFTQIYQVEKIGVSAIEKVNIKIHVPYAIKTGGKTETFLSIYPTEGKQADDDLTCYSNFEDYLQSEGNVDFDVERVRRDVSNVIVDDNNMTKLEASGSSGSKNKKFSIDCDSKNVECKVIVCESRVFKGHVNRAIIQLKMVFDKSKIADLLGKNDAIEIITYGVATVVMPSNFIQTGNLSDSAKVTSLFVSDVDSKIAWWIIALSIALGILLLLVIIIILVKTGFFKRSKKDELKILKEQEIAKRNSALLDDEEPLDDVFLDDNITILEEGSGAQVHSEKDVQGTEEVQDNPKERRETYTSLTNDD